MERLKIYITSCEISEGAWRDMEFKLKEFYELSDKRYDLTNDPQLADIIIVGNVREDNWGEKTLKNPFIRKFPDKCISMSDQDYQIILHHGVYASGQNSLIGRGRIRTGSYTLEPDKFKNPYILSFQYNENEIIDKQYLASFIGRNCHPVRNSLINLKFVRQDVLIEDSSTFNLWGTTDRMIERQKYFFEILLHSKFSLCPRGNAPNSYRLFESMKLGIAPIIISDEFFYPKGPKWNSFSIRVKETQINELENILLSYEDDFHTLGKEARNAYKEFFSEESYFNYVIENSLDIMQNQKIPERIYWEFNPLMLFFYKVKQKIGGR